MPTEPWASCVGTGAAPSHLRGEYLHRDLFEMTEALELYELTLAVATDRLEKAGLAEALRRLFGSG